MILAKLFTRKVNPAQPLYEAIVAAARQPHFYAQWQVPDTVDGRFDLLVLHLCLVVECLRSEAPELCQNLIDYFCTDMDGNLRELGAGDLSVGKKVRRMAEAFQGRYEAYAAARESETMVQALVRNVYAGKAAPDADSLAHYALQVRAELALQKADDIAVGKLKFA